MRDIYQVSTRSTSNNRNHLDVCAILWLTWSVSLSLPLRLTELPNNKGKQRFPPSLNKDSH